MRQCSVSEQRKWGKVKTAKYWHSFGVYWILPARGSSYLLDVLVEKFVLFKNVSYSLKGMRLMVDVVCNTETVRNNIIVQGMGTSVHSYKQYHLVHICWLSSLSEAWGCAAMLRSQECISGFCVCLHVISWWWIYVGVRIIAVRAVKPYSATLSTKLHSATAITDSNLCAKCLTLFTVCTWKFFLSLLGCIGSRLNFGVILGNMLEIKVFSKMVLH